MPKSSAPRAGCAVRVLVDDVGIRYSFPTILQELKRHRIEYRRFMPLRLLPPSLSINLRTHRKLLIVDRRLGLAGGAGLDRWDPRRTAPVMPTAD